MAKNYTVLPSAATEAISSPSQTVVHGMATLAPDPVEFFTRFTFAVTTVKANTVSPSPASMSFNAPGGSFLIAVNPTVGKGTQVSHSAPSVSVVQLVDPSPGAIISPEPASRLPKLVMSAPSVLAKVNGIWAVGASSISAQAPSVTVSKGETVKSVSPVSVDSSVPSASVLLSLPLSPDSGSLLVSVPDVSALVNQLIAPNAVYTTFSSPRQTVEHGTLELFPEAADVKHSSPSPSLLMGEVVRQVGATVVTASVTGPSVKEGLSQPTAYCSIASEFGAYCLLVPQTNAHCLVEPE